MKDPIHCTNQPEGPRLNLSDCDLALFNLRHAKRASDSYNHKAPRKYEFHPLPCATILVAFEKDTPSIRLSFDDIATSTENIVVRCKAQEQGGVDRLASGWYLMVDGGVVEVNVL